jgi:hypothetical protein
MGKNKKSNLNKLQTTYTTQVLTQPIHPYLTHNHIESDGWSRSSALRENRACWYLTKDIDTLAASVRN